MILNFRLYFAAFFLVITSFVFSQEFSVSGTVVNTSNKPIDFANVIILAEDGTTFIKGISTDSKGYFKINNLATATFVVKVSFIGFEEFEQKIILNGHLNLRTIQLKETPENLDEITVFGRKPTITRKPDRLVFNIENTALTEGSTLGVLKNTPGIIVSEGGINIKSASATIFINNRRVQLTSDELIQLLESAPANSITSVEVITNPPASYDADSGSVINIIMSKN
ncbi:MAG: carboxypeptidase-like regulatory domain-containing protein, partial [Winogradskyella sp.]